MHRLISALVGTFFLAGCTVFQPGIHLPPLHRADGSPSSATLEDAVVLVDNVRSQLTSRADETSALAGAAGLGTFVGLAGAGASALFGGSRDLILAFATGGATSFAAGNLYGSKGYISIYNAGSEALACVDGVARPLAARHRVLREHVTANETAQRNVNDRLAFPGLSFPPSQSADAIVRVNDARLLSASARNALASEPAAVASVHAAVAKIVNAVDVQINTLRPDTAAIAAAASGIGAAAQQYASNARVPKVAPAAAGSSSVKGAATPDPELQVLIKILEQSNKALEAATDNLGAAPVFSACTVANQITTSAVAIRPTGSIAMSQTDVINFTLNGGVLPYSQPSWIGQVPSELDVTYIDPFRIKISAKAGATWVAEKSYVFDIFDNTSGTRQHLTSPVTIITQ